MTLAPVTMPEARPPAPRSRDEELSAFVATRVAVLQERYTAADPWALGALAKLRRALTAAPGADPAVWGLTLDGLPTSLAGRSDDPSVSEWAAHAAITLFAVHQQSKTQARMHRLGQSLGAAVRRLGRQTVNEDAVRRRFHALGTATSQAETLHHLRGLVTQLRGQDIPLDYGQLAEDLRRLQDPRAADGVRLRWGRDYHRRTSTDSETDHATPDHATTDRTSTDTTPGDL